MDQSFIKKEREKARLLRKSSWWRRKLSLRTCYYCQHQFDPKDLTMDHQMPIARGGKSEKINIVTSCKLCNTEKGTMTLVEYHLAMESNKLATLSQTDIAPSPQP